MVALLGEPNGAISFVIRSEQERLTANVLKLIFEPAFTYRLGSDEAANWKLLRDEYAFEGAYAVREYEDALMINEFGLGEEIQSRQRTPHGQLQVGLRAITWGALATPFTVLFHSHCDVTSPSEAVKETGIRVIGF